MNETDKEFLDFGSYSTTDIWESDVTFAPESGTTTPTFGTFTIPTRDDPDEVEGMITVTLQNDNNDSNTPARYEIVSTATPATVRVIDVPLPTLSITAASNDVNEGGDADNEAKFVVTSLIDPIQTLTVNYTPYQEGDYVDTTNFSIDEDPQDNTKNLLKSIDLTFQANDDNTRWTATIAVPLRARDNKDAANGTIRIVLRTTHDWSKL